MTHFSSADSPGSSDAVVVGAGPNGLAAAIALAQAGRSVVVFEAAETVGGGCRSAELTLPGFVHDVCSAIHPLAVGSPLFRTLPLVKYGVEWLHPGVPLAHPLDDGTAVVLERSVEATAAGLGGDGIAYRRLMAPFVADADKILADFLGPLPLPPHHPIALTRFGLAAIRSARGLVNSRFEGKRARALFAGMAAHSCLPLERPPSAAFGLMLGLLGHAVGWPLPRGGSQRIVDALAACLRSLGGEIVTAEPVVSIDHLPPAEVVLLDVAPRQVLKLAGPRLPFLYRRQLDRFHYGPGVFKVDLALEGPVPWQADACRRAGTVHVGGTFEEIAAAERAVWRGEHPQHPFVLVAQQSLFDSSRAPEDKHTVWAYCHVPNGSTADMSQHIEAQIERFAPGFRSRILARSRMTAAEMQVYNANYVGGDINGGLQDLWQLFTRPAFRLVPYRTPAEGVYICSASTPPGGGVHGMCGYHAAQTALRDRF